MKKLFALLIIATMLLSLAACGGGNTDTPGGDETPGGENGGTPGGENGGNTDNPGGGENGGNSGGENTDNPGGSITELPEDFDLSTIMGGNAASDIIWGQQSEEVKAELIAQGAADGVEISFGADGSMTVVDPATGETLTQNPDGSWIIQNEDGSIGYYGKDWPENEFTKLLPKPEFEMTGASANEEEFAVLFQNVTVEQIRAYTEQVKAKGFTLNAETTDMETMGMVIYTYEAQNGAGYTVTVTFTAGASGLTVAKPYD